MIQAALLAGLSAALGGAIALLAQRRPAVLERTRTFAFAAAAGVVAFHLLPEVLPEQGPAALLWVMCGFALPWVLESAARFAGPRLLRGRGLSSARVAAEVGFAALLFHSVAEGLALTAALARPEGKLDLEVALVAHHAPLTAAVVLPFLALRGVRTVAARAAWIAAAGVGGVLASGAFPGLGEGAFLQRATAVTAGALLHVVSDEIRAQRFGSPWERAADFGACAAGLLVAGLGAALQLRHLERTAPVIQFLRALAGLSLLAAPALLFGALAGALLASRSRFFRWDALLLSLLLFGALPSVALAFLLLALSLGRRVPRSPGPERPAIPLELLAGMRQRGPALLFLSIAAAGLSVTTHPFPAEWAPAAGLMLGLALAARLDEAGGVLIAGVLVERGLDPGIAIALLASGPATRSASLRFLRLRILGVAGLAIGAGWGLSRTGALSSAPIAAEQALAGLHTSLRDQALASPLGAASCAVLLAIAAMTLWNAGARGWFVPLRHRPETA